MHSNGPGMNKEQAKLLIVDDSESNRLVLMYQLEDLGYAFLMAEGGQQALDLLEHEEVDLILLDIMMPDINGIDVLKSIKGNASLREIPVIMVTALGVEESLPECLELGASDYVSKPVQKTILRARVNSQLARKRAMDEVQASRLHLEQMVEERTSELQSTMKQLYQAQKMESIGTLAGGLAHDFNNVLSSITGNLFMIKQDAGDREKVHHRAAQINASCVQASEHISQLLSFSRKESVELARVEMSACVRAACEMAEVAISSNIDFHVNCSEEPLFVRWNEAQVQQSLLNLIINASHALEDVEQANIQVDLTLFSNNPAFMHEHPTMTDKYYVCLSVRDNGCGMSAEVKDKMFEPFYTTKGVDKGTGLGLAMVITSVNNADGIIEVESEVGSSTAFVMYFTQVQ